MKAEEIQELKEVCRRALYEAIYEGSAQCKVSYKGCTVTLYDDGTVDGPQELLGLWQETEEDLGAMWLEHEQLLSAGL